MRAWFFVLLTACSVLALPPAARGQTLLFDYVGLDFESPNPNSATFGEIGSGYQSVGFVPSLFSPLVADPANQEYTYHFSGLVAINQTSFGPFVIIDYSSPGTLNVYEDSKTSGTPGAYGTNPPNATAPPSFVDGTLFLAGRLTNFRFVINTSTGSGSFEAEYEAIGGSQISNIAPPRRTGWTFSGATGNATVIPTGYAHQIDGQVFLQEPVRGQASSWGRVKALYR